MKIVQINTFSNKSTGTIMMQIHNELLKNGHESYVVWARGRKSKNEYEICINDKIGIYFHGLYTRLTDKHGFASNNATRKLLIKLDKIKPDIIHLHNIHGYYINIEMLFDYIKKNNIKVIWTLHDCWAFTGHCPHFELINCDKWKNGGCHNCPQKNIYPKSIYDNSKYNYETKKRIFTGVNDLTIVTPSKWLANLVKQSFLKEYKTIVINNGIDTNIFKPTPSDFRKIYNLENKKIILGVASDWTKSKGYYDFIELSKIIDDNYKIVMIGLRKDQISNLPANIIGLTKTKNIQDLVKIYSAADIYFNTSKEETFGLTTIESIACGTPAIVYNSTALPEVAEEVDGMIIDELKQVLELIKKIPKAQISLIKKFEIQNMINKYFELYTKVDEKK